jgi:hypothetical protein
MQKADCEHKIGQWRGMPYDFEKRCACYRLFCFECGSDLAFETFLPGNLDPFSLEHVSWQLGSIDTGDSKKNK